MINTKSFRLAPVLVLIGEVVSTVIVLYIHPGGGETIEATFMNYAASRYWVAIHLAQFCGTAILLAGVLAFFHILRFRMACPTGSVSSGQSRLFWALHWLGASSPSTVWRTRVPTTSYLDMMLGWPLSCSPRSSS